MYRSRIIVIKIVKSIAEQEYKNFNWTIFQTIRAIICFLRDPKYRGYCSAKRQLGINRVFTTRGRRSFLCGLFFSRTMDDECSQRARILASGMTMFHVAFCESRTRNNSLSARTSNPVSVSRFPLFSSRPNLFKLSPCNVHSLISCYAVVETYISNISFVSL